MTADPAEIHTLARVRDAAANAVAEGLVALNEHIRHGQAEHVDNDAAVVSRLIALWESANAAVTAAAAQGDQQP